MPAALPLDPLLLLSGSTGAFPRLPTGPRCAAFRLLPVPPGPAGGARPCGVRPGGLPTPGRGSAAACRGLWAGLPPPPGPAGGRPPVPQVPRCLQPRSPGRGGGPGFQGTPGGLRRWSRGSGAAPAPGSLGLRFYPSLQSANELICSFWDVV